MCLSKQIRVAVKSAGVNFIDTYIRSGLYKSNMPVILGREGSGVVVDAGDAGAKIGITKDQKVMFLCEAGGYQHDFYFEWVSAFVYVGALSFFFFFLSPP